MLGAGIMRVRIGIARDCRDCVERVFRLPVIAKGAVALFYLLHLAQRVWLVAAMPPHFFSFYEKGIPVIDAGVNREQPVMWSGNGARHGLAVTGELYNEERKKQ